MKMGVSFALLGLLRPAFALSPPPEPQVPGGPATTGGIRTGICESNAAANVDVTTLDFIALAPQQYIAETLSTEPTLTWFVPAEEAFQMEFDIYELVEGQSRLQIVDVKEDISLESSRYGYMSYTIPADFGLKVGSTYFWRATLICNPDVRSGDMLVGGEFKIVSRSEGLSLAEGDTVQQARQYAEAGLWHDAMALLSDNVLSAPADAYRRELLQALADLERGVLDAAYPDMALADANLTEVEAVLHDQIRATDVAPEDSRRARELRPQVRHVRQLELISAE